VTRWAAAQRLNKLVKMNLATVARFPARTGQLADHYEITIPSR
jgi:hypothetical protein